MNMRLFIPITLIVLIGMTAACGGGTTAPTPTSIPPSPTATDTVAPTATLAPTATATPEPQPTRQARSKRRRTPTPTLDLQAALTGRLVDLEDSKGLLYLQYPASLTQVESSVEEESERVGYTLASPDEQEQLVVVISVEKGTPLNDEEWKQALLPAAITFASIMGEDAAEQQVIKEARSIYLEAASDDTYGLFFTQEKSGVVGSLIWVMPLETWQNQRQDVASKVIGSFVWSPYTVRRFFGDIQTYRDPAGLFSLPLPTHVEQVETLDDHPMYGLMARSEQTGERLLFLLFDTSTDELDDLFFDTVSQLEVKLFGRPMTAEAETTYDAQDFLVTFTDPFDSADGANRGVEAIWEPQQGVRALFFWLAPTEVFTGSYAGDVVAPIFLDIVWDPARASAYFAAQGPATPQAPPTPMAGASRPVITAENATAIREIGRLGLKGYVTDIAWSPDGTMLAVAASDRLFLYNGRTLEQAEPPEELKARFVRFSPDGNVLYTIQGDEQQPDGPFYLTARPVKRLDSPLWSIRFTNSDGILDLAISPDGRLLAVADGNATLHLVDAKTGKVAATFEMTYKAEEPPPIQDVDFSPDGALVGAAMSHDALFQVWRVADGGVVAQGNAGIPSPTSILFASLERFYVAGYSAVAEWSTDGIQVNRFKVDGEFTVDAALGANGSLLLLAAPDVLFVDRDTGRTLHRIAGMAPLALSADGTLLAFTRGESLSTRDVVIFGVQP